MRSTELAKLTLLLVAVKTNLELDGNALDGAEAVLIDVITALEGMLETENRTGGTHG